MFTPARQKEVSPDEAIARLKAGNERFLAGKSVNCNLMEQVKETAKGQAPFAAIVGCIDSRVPPELVFDQRIGDVFCARIAGNFVNTDIVGSLEFATKIAGARAIVVLGHSECGAIKGAVDDVRLGNLTAALAKIRPAVDATTADGDRTAKNSAFVQAVAVTNAKARRRQAARGKPADEGPGRAEAAARRAGDARRGHGQGDVSGVMSALTARPLLPSHPRAKRFLLPSLPFAKRMAGRGRGWGATHKERVRFLPLLNGAISQAPRALNRPPPPTPPPPLASLAGGRGEVTETPLILIGQYDSPFVRHPIAITI